MAIVHFCCRGWRPLVIQLVLIAMIIGMWMLMPSRDGGAAQAQSALNLTEPSAGGEAAEKEPAIQVDPAVYSQVQSLREDLALTSQDLAAYGATKEQATAVLNMLRDWVEVNQSSLQQADVQVHLAERDLRMTWQAIHVGPRDEAKVRSIPSLEQRVEQVKQSRTGVQNGAAAQVASILGGDQRLMWERTRENVDLQLSGVYRYASSITKEQAQKLDVALRRRSAESREDRVSRSGALNAGQVREATEARARIQQHIDGVLEAEEAALPVPPELAGPVLPVNAEELNRLAPGQADTVVP